MKIRIIGLIMTVSFVLSAFSACGSAEREVYNIDISNEVSGEVDIAFSFESKEISEGLYRYIYKYYKDLYLELCKSIVLQNGYLSNTDNITVEDTEAFWNSVVPEDVHNSFAMLKSQYYGFYRFEITDEDLGSYTYADVVFDHANSECREYLIYNALAAQYNYVPSKDYKDYAAGLEAAITHEATNNADCFVGVDSISDASGVLYDWAKERWEVYLAGKGITKDEWVSAFYDFSILKNNLPAHIAEKAFGTLGDGASDEQIVEYYIDQRNMAQVSFDYICYDLLSEENYNKQKKQGAEESSAEENSLSDGDFESSELNSLEENSEDVGSEESSKVSDVEEPKFDPLVLETETYEEYVELRKKACREIYENIVNGTTDFDTALKESPYYDSIEEEHSYGVYLENASFYEWFGKKAEDVEIGAVDIFVKENMNTVWIIRYCELLIEDYTEEDISLIAKEFSETYKKSLQYEEMNTVFDAAYSYIGNIDIKNEYSKPWEID